MKTNYFLIISAFILAAMLCTSPAWCETPGSGDQYVSYEGYIDKAIQHSEFKSTLGSPTSPNLQKNAEVSREKTEFLKNNRDALIRKMEADNVEKKPYKMTHYLNQAFYDSSRPGEIVLGTAAIEAYEEPE